MRWQLLEKVPFMFKGLGGNETGFALGALFHAHGRPFQSLPIEIFQALESAAGQEVGLGGRKAAFLARFPIGVPRAWQRNRKPVGFGENLHLGDDHRLGAQAAQSGQVGVVDHANPGRITPVHQRSMQEALHLETIKDAIKLQIPALGVAQIKKAGLELSELGPGQW